MNIYIILLLISLAAGHPKRFQFNEKGEFTILQITDLHFGENEELDKKTMDVQRKLLEVVRPDIVVITGDALSGNFWKTLGAKQGYFEENWKKWTQPFTEYETYYAYLLGNHDSEADLTRREIMQLDMTHPYSVSQLSEEGMSGASTYSIPVYSSINHSKAAANLWIFDSGSEGCDGVNEGYGCIEKDQVAWYNRESQKFKSEHGSNSHHLAFFHIPLPEYMELYNEHQFYGVKEEATGCSAVNTGLFSSVLKNGDISAIFVGHDHVNDYGGFLEGVELLYGRKTGYGSYGPGHGLMKGGRVIKLKEGYDKMGLYKVTRTHYIVNEDGTYDFNQTTQRRNESKQMVCFSPSGFLEVDKKPQPFTSTFPEDYETEYATFSLSVTMMVFLGLAILKRYLGKDVIHEMEIFTSSLEL